MALRKDLTYVKEFETAAGRKTHEANNGLAQTSFGDPGTQALAGVRQQKIEVANGKKTSGVAQTGLRAALRLAFWHAVLSESGSPMRLAKDV